MPRAVPIIRQATTHQGAVSLVMRRLGGLTLPEASRLVSMARAAQRAAYDLQTAAGGVTASPASVPVNPWLNMDDPQGRRYEYQVAVSYTAPGESRPTYRQAVIDSGRLLTLAEVEELGHQSFIDKVGRSPPWPRSRVPGVSDLTYRLESIQRKF